MALSGHSKLVSEKLKNEPLTSGGPRLELLSRGHRPVESGLRIQEIRRPKIRRTTWFKVLWESPESASYNGAFRALKASFGKAEKRAPNLLGPRVLSFYRVG